MIQMISSIKDKIKDYSEEELREWIKETFSEYKQDQEDANIFRLIEKYKGHKRVFEIEIMNYIDSDIKFVSVDGQRMYGNYLGHSCPCDTFEEVVDTEKQIREYINEDEEKEVKHYETIPLF